MALRQPIQIRLSENERAILQAAAGDEPLSSWMRDRCLEVASGGSSVTKAPSPAKAASKAKAEPEEEGQTLDDLVKIIPPPSAEFGSAWAANMKRQDPPPAEGSSVA